MALLEMFEEEWQTYYLQIPLLLICAFMFLLVSCLGGMRGFEVVWTDLAALRYDIAYVRLQKMILRSPGLSLGDLRPDMEFLTVR